MMPAVLAPEEAAMIAHRQLYILNLESWRPEVEDWLHSAEAQPELEKLLEVVPCHGGIH